MAARLRSSSQLKESPVKRYFKTEETLKIAECQIRTVQGMVLRFRIELLQRVPNLLCRAVGRSGVITWRITLSVRRPDVLSWWPLAYILVGVHCASMCRIYSIRSCNQFVVPNSRTVRVASCTPGSSVERRGYGLSDHRVGTTRGGGTHPAF